MLLKGYSETGRFTHLSDQVLGGRNFGNTKSVGVTFSFKVFKIYAIFQKFSKKLRKSFFYLK